MPLAESSKNTPYNFVFIHFTEYNLNSINRLEKRVKVKESHYPQDGMARCDWERILYFQKFKFTKYFTLDYKLIPYIHRFY